MARCAAAQVVVLLLALAAGASAQTLTCTAASITLHFLSPRESEDFVAKCLTGMRINIAAANCAVTITPLNSAGSYVDGIWAADDSKVYDVLRECPHGTGASVLPTTGGTKSDAMQAAIMKALRGFVYGFDANKNYNRDLEITGSDWYPGRVTFGRASSDSLIYAITETNVDSADMKDDNGNLLEAITACSQLGASLAAQCLNNTQQADPCPANSYGVLIKPNLYAYNEQQTQFKVCGLCPAGTFGNGTGCSPCPRGQFSKIGGACSLCPAGTYSPTGSSDCQPCTEGTFSDSSGSDKCQECPEDSYSWIPGSTYCLRCTSGIPEICDSNGCLTGDPDPGEPKSSPATHILSMPTMPTCALDASTGLYELKAYYKCSSWKTGTTPMMQLALTVAGDCSIQISPITDPACADPTSTVGYQYGAIQMTAYYKSPTEIRTLMAPGQSKSLMLAIDVSGSNVALKWFGATTDAKESQNTDFIKAPAGSDTRKTCSATASITGGQLLKLPSSPDVICPPGTYYHSTEFCPICPVGYRCPGGGQGVGLRIPCTADYFNPLLGLGGACTQCDPSGDTSYAGAATCVVTRIDTECKLNNTGGTGMEYDKAAQECKACPPGTARNDAANVCDPCPPGTYSGEGAAVCEPCPKGQFSPSEGLADQTDITGLKCEACAEGSMPLKSSTAAGVNALIEEGSTFCDACPSGTYKPNDDLIYGPITACKLCEENTYRAGDATPENNVCKRVPAGYMLADDSHSTIMLCPKGTVSFWYTDSTGAEARAPGKNTGDDKRCLACSQLDAEVGNTLPTELAYAHTYAPRRGMTKCIPCPAGTVPRNSGVGADMVTEGCKPCANGYFRDAYSIVSECEDCGPGKEVGSSSKMSCEQCRPGYFMDQTRSNLTGVEANTCAACEKNSYRPTYGATSCLPCPRGTMTLDEGNTECTECPVGYYNNVAGEDCQPAAAGTFVNTTGAFVSTPCPQGSWNDELASDNCNPCAPGKYSNTVGSRECKTCPAGTYSSGQANRCIDCLPGFAAPAGASACSPCKPSTYAPNYKTATCQLCPKGFQCPTNAMKREAPCPRGTFSNREGLRICSPCPINTISQGGASGTPCTILTPCPVMACTKCPTGTSTRGLVGQSRCQALRPQVKRLFF